MLLFVVLVPFVGMCDFIILFWFVRVCFRLFYRLVISCINSDSTLPLKFFFGNYSIVERFIVGIICVEFWDFGGILGGFSWIFFWG